MSSHTITSVRKVVIVSSGVVISKQDAFNYCNDFLERLNDKEDAIKQVLCNFNKLYLRAFYKNNKFIITHHPMIVVDANDDKLDGYYDFDRFDHSITEPTYKDYMKLARIAAKMHYDETFLVNKKTEIAMNQDILDQKVSDGVLPKPIIFLYEITEYDRIYGVGHHITIHLKMND